jgi:hypothetical protein
MQQATTIKTVLAIVGLSIAFIFSGIGQALAAPTSDLFKPYGSIAQEDQIAVQDKDGYYWVNIVPSQGNGMFMKITDLDDDYSIDQAIDRFGIDEDIQEFEVQPSLYSDATFLYQLDDDLQFQMVAVFGA